jgi:benzoate/toluate 1,2-dioxygenase beta subunit
MSANQPTPRQFEEFLIHEARLLDEQRYDDWLALFTADAWYWVPIEPGQKNPHDTVSLMYDDRRMLETRVRRLSKIDRVHAQEPRSRTSHIVANVTVEEEAPTRGDYVIRSKFQMLEYRRDKQRLFGGTCLHGLTSEGLDRNAAQPFKIRWKRVDLVNCESMHDGLSVPF